MLIYLPQVIFLIGLVLYLLSTNAKAMELGRLMFLAGMIGTCIIGLKT
jgi:hypothetical protein